MTSLIRWHLLLMCFVLCPLAVWAQDAPGPLQETIAPLTIPAEWGTLKSVTPLPGSPQSFSFFLEDSAGTIRIVPVHLSLSGNTWYLLRKGDPVAVIRRGP